MRSAAKSYMRKGLLIYVEIRKYLTMYEEAVSLMLLFNRSLLNFLIYEKNLIFFISVRWKENGGRRRKSKKKYEEVSYYIKDYEIKEVENPSSWCLSQKIILALSIRHVTIVPFGNKAFYWLSGTKNLSAANRKAVTIHVTTPVICISERFFPHTAHSRRLRGGGRGEILHHKFSICI
jgi:hypothetical protein